MFKVLLRCSIISLLLIGCYPAPKVAGEFSDEEFEKMATKMSEGEIPDLSVDETFRQKNLYIFLDTREKKEFDVSHIPNALWVGYKSFKLDLIEHLPKDKKIVTYCSVGYRSERVAKKMREAGYENVFNLKGSFFEWCNKFYPIVGANNQSTQKVHGYNSKWSKWLKRSDVVY